MNRVSRIALVWHTQRRRGSDVMTGVADYAERYGPWRFFFNQIGDFRIDDFGERTDFDGIIVFRDFDPALDEVRWPAGVPLVSVEHAYSTFTPHQVMPDYHAVGRLVAEEFIARGYRRLAYCPRSDLRIVDPLYRWDHEMRGAMADAVVRAGAEFLPFPDIPRESLREAYDPPIAPLAEWFRSLQRPVAMLAASDVRAYHVMLAAEALGIRVPDDLAVVGVHNEPWTSIALRGVSSVELDDYRAGYLAGQMLHQLMSGQLVDPKIVRVPPRRLITRRSSDTTAIDDPDVAAAIRFIADHANSPIEVRHVVAAVTVSRRSIELRFRRVRHHSIQQEIRLARIARARNLLRDEAIPLGRVAALSGFVSLKAMDAMFRRIVGTTPAAWRGKIRAAAAADDD